MAESLPDFGLDLNFLPGIGQEVLGRWRCQPPLGHSLVPVAVAAGCVRMIPVRRATIELRLPGHDHGLTIIRYGYGGRPVLVFPHEAGRASDFENHGMVESVYGLLDAGRVTLFCVDSLDAWSWSDESAPIEERARRHQLYHSWVVEEAVPWIRDATASEEDLLAVGCSLGAYHAVHLALQRPDLVPAAIGLSGNYDLSTWHVWGDRGEASYRASPADYVAHLGGEHLAELRGRLSLLLVCGQGAWETHPTGALPSTRRLAELLREKGISCELDLWGDDVSHDWPWWRRQLAHHLPAFC
jgi:esterase/lipase superfamily enzyme